MNTFRVIDILDPLVGGRTEHEYTHEAGKALSEYLGYEGDAVVMCNGIEVHEAVTDIYPAAGEEYVFMAVPEGSDKQTLRIVSMAALTILTSGIGLGWTGWSGAAAFGVSQAARAGVWFVGMNAINLFLRDKEQNQNQSQSYQWGYTDNQSAAHGAAMPVIYGKTRVRPVIKNRFVRIDGDKQELYALYGVAAHKVDERTVSAWSSGTIYRIGNEVVFTVGAEEPGKTYLCMRDHVSTPFGPFPTNARYWKPGRGTASFANDIILNGRAITGYNDDVEWETRPGLVEQAIISGFDATYANYTFSTALYLSCPEVNKDVASIGRGTVLAAVRWNKHQVWLDGISYMIDSGSLRINTGADYNYIYFDPAIDDGAYQTGTTLPDVSKLVATFEGDNGAPEYYCVDAWPQDDDWTTPSQLFSDCHNIEVAITFPYGLYGQTSGGSIKTSTANIFAQYREYGDTEWTDFDFGEGALKTQPVSGVDTGRRNEDNNGLYGVVSRNQTTPFTILINAVDWENSPLDTTKSYQVRVTASGPASIQLSNIACVVYAEPDADGVRRGFTYPGEPLIGIKALASGQVDNDLDVQVDVERSQVWVYNTRYTTDRDGNPSDGRWVRGDASLHAWAVYDILANGHPDHPAYPVYGNEDAEAIYGCGVDKNRLDYESFRTWAEHTSALGYSLNIVFDVTMNAWDAILRICQEGRGMVYPVGAKIYAFTDMEGDVAQLFTVGNIHLDTFTQQFMNKRNKANMVELTYCDEENNYERTSLSIRADDWDESDIESVPQGLTLYGTTKFEQAVASGVFLMRCNQYLDSMVSFGVDVDALGVAAGDVIEVQHDVLGSGEGGRILDVSHNLVLDGSFETTGNPNWTKWKLPTIWWRSTDQSKYGTYSMHTRSTSDNGGVFQEFAVEGSTTYTLSCWIYMLNVYTATATIRAMTRALGGLYSKAFADKTMLNQWQRVSVTFTTAPFQTTATVWLGGIGEAYFDGVMFNEGLTADDYIEGTKLTLDRELAVSPGQQYTMAISQRDGTVEYKRGMTSGNVSGDVVTFGDAWSWGLIPEGYEPYAFNGTALYRVINISRTSELMRTITALKYDTRIYTGYTPGGSVALPVAKTAVGPVAPVLNIATDIVLREITSQNRVSGEYESSVVVTWNTVNGNARGSWEVWFRDVDGSDTRWQGEWDQGTVYSIGDKVELDGKTYVSLEDGNASQPRSG